MATNPQNQQPVFIKKFISQIVVAALAGIIVFHYTGLWNKISSYNYDNKSEGGQKPVEPNNDSDVVQPISREKAGLNESEKTGKGYGSDIDMKDVKTIGLEKESYITTIELYDEEPKTVCNNRFNVKIDIWSTKEKLEIWKCDGDDWKIDKKMMQLGDSFCLSNDCCMILKRIEEERYESGRKQRIYAIFEQRKSQ